MKAVIEIVDKTHFLVEAENECDAVAAALMGEGQAINTSRDFYVEHICETPADADPVPTEEPPPDQDPPLDDGR